MMHLRLSAAAALILLCTGGAFAQEVPADVQAANQLLEAGDVAGAVAALQRAVASAPRSFDARLSLGRALDLEGKHEAARTELEEAVKLATDEQRNAALTALGISYAFESKPDEAARYYQRAFDAEVQADDRAGAAGIANALGRIYLESGNLRKAEEWYRTGYEMARKIAGQPASQGALWDMRWSHALARIEARRGNRAAADRHAASAAAAFDKGLPENQRSALPYLRGYLAFYAKDYGRAAEELLKGDLEDPFVLGLIAQSYDRLKDRERAAEYYRKVMASPAHNINAAFSRPVARRSLR